MSNVLTLVNRMIIYLISSPSGSPFVNVINFIKNTPYLLIGISCVIVGFVIGLIRRLIST